MGRPPLPDGEVKDVQVGVKIKASLAAQISSNIAESQSPETRAEWIRNAAINEVQSPPIWVKSSWKKEELDGQLVEFKLVSPNRELSGVGKFNLRENPKGEIAVYIFIDEYPMRHQGVTTRIWLGQQAVDKIEINPNPEKAKFRVIA